MEQYISSKQIQRALGLSRTGIHLLLKRGDMPAGIRVGRSRRWKESEINLWLKDLEGK